MRLTHLRIFSFDFLPFCNLRMTSFVVEVNKGLTVGSRSVTFRVPELGDALKTSWCRFKSRTKPASTHCVDRWALNTQAWVVLLWCAVHCEFSFCQECYPTKQIWTVPLTRPKGFERREKKHKRGERNKCGHTLVKSRSHLCLDGSMSVGIEQSVLPLAYRSLDWRRALTCLLRDWYQKWWRSKNFVIPRIVRENGLVNGGVFNAQPGLSVSQHSSVSDYK